MIGSDPISDDVRTSIAPPAEWELDETAKDIAEVDAIADVGDETLEEARDLHLDIWATKVRCTRKTAVDINAHDPNASPRDVALAIES